MDTLLSKIKTIGDMLDVKVNVNNNLMIFDGNRLIGYTSGKENLTVLKMMENIGAAKRQIKTLYLAIDNMEQMILDAVDASKGE